MIRGGVRVAIALLLLATAGLLGSTIYAIATDVRLPEPTMAAALEPGALPPAGPIQRLQIVRVYRDNCSACHGEDGSGSPVRAAMPTIPDFRSMAWQTAKTDLEIVHQIQDGKEPVMPPFRGKLSQKQILGLAIYLRAFAVDTAAETHPRGRETIAGGPAQANDTGSQTGCAAKPEGNPTARQETHHRQR